MDQTVLVGLDIALGEEIVKALDAAGLKVSVAMWVNLPEYDDWRFLVAAKSLDNAPGIEAHKLIARAMRKAGIPVENTPPLLIYEMTKPFIRKLRRQFAKVEGLTGLRWGGQPVGDRWANGAYLYRVR